MKIMTCDEVEKLIESDDISIIDVREPMEVAFGKIPNAIHIPLGEIESRVNELSKETKYAVVCRSGNRSGVASQFLNSLGYNTYNMVGGMMGWKGKVVSTV